MACTYHEPSSTLSDMAKVAHNSSEDSDDELALFREMESHGVQVLYGSTRGNSVRLDGRRAPIRPRFDRGSVAPDARANTGPKRDQDRAAIAWANGCPPVEVTGGRPTDPLLDHLLPGVEHHRSDGQTIAEAIRRTLNGCRCDHDVDELRLRDAFNRRRRAAR